MPDERFFYLVSTREDDDDENDSDTEANGMMSSRTSEPNSSRGGDEPNSSSGDVGSGARWRRQRYPVLDSSMTHADCYRSESASETVMPWEDESKPDLAQNMAHVWVYEVHKGVHVGVGVSRGGDSSVHFFFDFDEKISALF